MSSGINITPIGEVKVENGQYSIVLKDKYISGLKSIEGFSYLQIVWWGNLYDTPEARENLVLKKPYKKGPEEIGVFATRSPVRPNPILITTVYVSKLEIEKGIIQTPWIDAENGTPILDIKPFHKNERMKDISVPDWCNHWPEWYEDCGEFDWGQEFNF